MRGRTIEFEVTDKRGKAAKTIPLYQYDYGQKLLIKGVELPEYYEVHFSNQQYGDAITVLGDSTGVLIPDSLVATGETIYVWLFLHDTSYDGETEYMGAIPVIKRAQPTDITPTPEEQSIITEVIAALNNMEDDMSEQVQAAETAKEAAQTAQTAAEGAATTASGYVDTVTAAQTAAEAAQAAAETAATSATASATSATSSANSANNALAEATNAKIAAVDAASVASTSATTATTASGNASNYATSAESAKVDAVAAKDAAEAAQTAAETAQGKAEDAQGAAETAQTAAEAAQTAAETAQGKAEDAQEAAEDSAEDSEAYAVGTRNGVDVESDDPAYENNAKYYAEEAAAVLADKLDAPATAGTAGQVLTSDGEGGQAWADPSGAIDDTAGEGDTDVTWSADKLDGEFADVLTAIQGKYEKPSGGIPASDMAEGVIPTVPTVATQAQIKGGTDELHPIAPIYQHESVFYAFAKLAGVDMAQSSNPVGQFTDSAKTAIQKMLGIYESPWELIREDTVTNATEADIEITVDGYGEALELTDIRMVFWLPKQIVQSAKGDYGRIFFYYDESNSDVAYLGAWQQAANASAKGGYAELVHDGNMIIKSYTSNTTIGSSSNIQTLVSNENDRGMYILTNRTYSKIVITAVTGTAKYRLFGRRKWN